MKVIAYSLLLLLALWTINALAQRPTGAAAPLPTASAPLSAAPGGPPTLDPTGAQRVALLEAQLQTMRDYHSSLLDTVYFALAGVFLLASLLVGFGWFANFKVYERDKLALRAELEAIVVKASGELKAEAAIAATAAGKDVQAGMSSASQAISETLHKQVDGVRVEVTSLVGSAQRSIEARLADLGRKHHELHAKYLREKMQSNPSPNMALTDALTLLELNRGETGYDIADTLSFMLKTIEKGGKLTADEITRLHRVFDGLPSHYQTLVEKLRAKVVASDVM